MRVTQGVKGHICLMYNYRVHNLFWIFLIQMKYHLQSMYNHVVGRTVSIIPPFYSLLLGVTPKSWKDDILCSIFIVINLWQGPTLYKMSFLTSVFNGLSRFILRNIINESLAKNVYWFLASFKTIHFEN